MNPDKRSTVNLLIAGIDAMIKNPNVNMIVISRNESEGIEGVNITVGDYCSGLGKVVVSQEFKQGDQTIYDKDAAWKERYTDVEEQLAVSDNNRKPFYVNEFIDSVNRMKDDPLVNLFDAHARYQLTIPKDEYIKSGLRVSKHNREDGAIKNVGIGKL